MAIPRSSPWIGRPNHLVLATVAACLFAVSAVAASAQSPSARGETSPQGVAPPSISADNLELAGQSRTDDLYLEVFHGARSTGLVVRLRLRDGQLRAARADLRAVGLIVPDETELDSEGLISLDALPGLVYRYEPASQRLVLQIPPDLRPVQRLGYQTPAVVDVRRDPGWLLGYDAYSRALNGDQTFAVASSLRRFGPAGAIELTGVSRAGDNAIGYQRLDTRWTYSDPRRLWSWTAGDLISGGLSWSRPVRMAGFQWRRNFATRPDLITLPMPRFSAQTTVPSTVELFVNNIRHFGTEVQDGPFVLDALPRISGAGQASLIVTDALGRVTETTLPLYIDHERLAPGLSDFSVEAGLLRHGFATADGDDYGDDPVVSGSWRRGLTDAVTLEGHGEAGPGVRLAGVGAVWSPWSRWGLATASIAVSDGDPSGNQYTLGYQWYDVRYGLDVLALRRSRGFRDLGDVRVDSIMAVPSLRAQDRATFWLAVPRGSLAVTWLRWRDSDGRDRDTRSLSWTQNLGARLSLSASLFDDSEGGRGGGLSLSIPLGDQLHASASVRRSEDRTSLSATLRRSAPYEGGWGWRVEGGDRPGGYAQAAAEVRGRYGEAWFGVDRTDERTGIFFQGAGSMALMDGQLFLSRRIHDAFAVVSTQAVTDVPIHSENRLFGRTNGDGYLLIPELRGWQRNRLAIDPSNLGPNYRVGAVEQMATPADQSGVLVEFDVTEVNPAIVVLLGPNGEPVPAGSRGRLVRTGREILVGFGGEAYLEDVTEETVIELEVSGVGCRYRVPVTADTARSAGLRREPLACERIDP
ncbi:MAG: fimbria/pilus outer membrane usher protein [Luteitalea sp.]|nr:fimbria/pilus outer membrane usher protein [Luteitalea sp.]